MKKKGAILLVLAMVSQLVMYPLAASADTLYVANDMTKSTAVNTTLSFSAQDFINSVNLPEGGSLVSVRFDQVTNPNAGNLLLAGSAVTKGQTVPVAALDQLTFVPVTNYEGEAIFTWTANYGDRSSPYPGAVIITIGGSGAVPPAAEGETSPEATQEAQQPSGENGEEANDQNDGFFGILGNLVGSRDDAQPSEEAEPTEEAQESAEPESSEEPSEEPETSPEPSEEPSEEPEASEEPSESTEPEPTLKPLQYQDMLEHWGAYSAGLLATRGLIIGEEYNDIFYFEPERILTRYEFLRMVNAVFDIQPKDSLEGNPFADSDVPSYMMRLGIASYEAGILSGSEEADGLYFRPNDRITRVEAIKLLDNALKVETMSPDDLDFADTNDIPAWGLQAVKNMEAYGIVRGYEDNTIRPWANITKAQAAEMVYQALKYQEKRALSTSAYPTVVYDWNENE